MQKVVMLLERINNSWIITGNRLNYIFILSLSFFFSFESAFCSISICSWNIENLGNSKSDVEIDFMATTIQNFDVIAIQEVVANAGGPRQWPG